MKKSFIKPSTRAFVNEARKMSNYSFFDFIHGYVYARWPYFYIGVGKGKHPATKWLATLSGFFNHLILIPKNEETDEEKFSFADTYHGKVVPLVTVQGSK